MPKAEITPAGTIMRSTLMPFLFSLFFVIVFLFSGCATGGGTIGGLLPAPKLWKGKVQNGIYTSPHGNFSVQIPQFDRSYEFQHMQFKEQYSAPSDLFKMYYVSFGPAAMDHSIFRISLLRWAGNEDKVLSFPESVNRIFESTLNELEKGYNAPLREIHRGQTALMEQEAVYGIWEQDVVAFSDGKRQKVYQVMYFVRNAGHDICFGIELRPDDFCIPGARSGICHPKDLRGQLIAGTYAVVNQFIGSFKLTP